MAAQKAQTDSATAEKEMRFIVPQAIRLFKPTMPGRMQLYRSGEALQQGDSVKLKDVWVMYYDHGPKIATEVFGRKETSFILVEEISDELRELCLQMARSAEKLVRRGGSDKEATDAYKGFVSQIVLGIRKHGRAELRPVS